MERNKLLAIAVVLLLVLNLGTLAHLFFTPDKKMLPPPQQGDRQPPPFAPMLQQQLQLNNEQTAQVQQIHEGHLQKMDSLEKQYRQALQQYFDLLLQDNFQQQLKDSLENILSLITKQRAAEAFHHFYSIKEILNPQQVFLYQKRLPQILEPVLHNRKNSGQPPKE